mgnify:CR=1 FL=1
MSAMDLTPYLEAGRDARLKRAAVAATVKAMLDVELIGGIGWCGPQWRQAYTLEAELCAAAGIECWRNLPEVST